MHEIVLGQRAPAGFEREAVGSPALVAPLAEAEESEEQGERSIISARFPRASLPEVAGIPSVR